MLTLLPVLLGHRTTSAYLYPNSIDGACGLIISSKHMEDVPQPSRIVGRKRMVRKTRDLCERSCTTGQRYDLYQKYKKLFVCITHTTKVQLCSTNVHCTVYIEQRSQKTEE